MVPRVDILEKLWENAFRVQEFTVPKVVFTIELGCLERGGAEEV